MLKLIASFGTSRSGFEFKNSYNFTNGLRSDDELFLAIYIF